VKQPCNRAYRVNRAVIFDADQFHKTGTIDFGKGYRNHRINISVL
jgi:hypothetical protein